MNMASLNTNIHMQNTAPKCDKMNGLLGNHLLLVLYYSFFWFWFGHNLILKARILPKERKIERENGVSRRKNACLHAHTHWNARITCIHIISHKAIRGGESKIIEC